MKDARLMTVLEVPWTQISTMHFGATVLHLAKTTIVAWKSRLKKIVQVSTAMDIGVFKRIHDREPNALIGLVMLAVGTSPQVNRG